MTQRETPTRSIAFRHLADLEILLGFASKILSAGTYFLSALLTGIFLTLSEQGFFFSFLSFATLTVLVELGLSTVVIQFTSHEMADFETASDEPARARALSRLQGIGHIAFRWFWSGAVIFMFLVGISGYFFFASEPGAEVVLPGPWLMLTAMVSIDLALNPLWSLLEGARRIKSVYAYRSAKAVLMGVGTCGALALGLGLWALPIGFLFTLPLAAWPIIANWDFFRLFISSPGTNSAISWRDEMLPLQWRLAISWIAGYFANWAITPISLKMFGSAVAGQVGMTWALATGISTIAAACVLVKTSRFGYLVATRQYAELDRLAIRQGTIFLSLLLLGGLSATALVWLANRLGLGAANRVLPLLPLSLFLIGTLLQQSTLPLAVYLRSFKREPFMWLSVTAAALFLGVFLVGGTTFGILGVAIGYIGISLFFVVPVALTIFLRLRRAWTQEPAA